MMKAEIPKEMIRSRIHADISRAARPVGWADSGFAREGSGVSSIVVQFYWIRCSKGNLLFEALSDELLRSVPVPRSAIFSAISAVKSLSKASSGESAERLAQESMIPRTHDLEAMGISTNNGRPTTHDEISVHLRLQPRQPRQLFWIGDDVDVLN